LVWRGRGHLGREQSKADGRDAGEKQEGRAVSGPRYDEAGNARAQGRVKARRSRNGHDCREVLQEIRGLDGTISARLVHQH
jgi:hypothetical protein